jgi:hypothetical protein
MRTWAREGYNDLEGEAHELAITLQVTLWSRRQLKRNHA